MTEILKLIRTSKTAKSGVLTIVVGILILCGLIETPAPQTIDDMTNQQTNTKEVGVGIGILLNGLFTLYGRQDAEKKIVEKDTKIKELEAHG